MAPELQGLCAVLATPFDSSGRLDIESLEREVGFYLDRGARSLMALGVMGEGPALTHEERLEVVRTVARSAGSKTPLVVGAVGMPRHEACEFGEAVSGAGASALMLTAPPAAKDSLAAATDYFGTVSAAAGCAPSPGSASRYTPPESRVTAPASAAALAVSSVPASFSRSMTTVARAMSTSRILGA